MTIRHRECAGWIPSWDGVIYAWARKFLSTNLWRYNNPNNPDPTNGLEDLMQDAYLVFLRCYKRYPRVVDPPHFMSLFKRALLREMINKTRKNQERSSAITCDSELLEEVVLNNTEDHNNNGYMNVLLGELPVELRMALETLSSKDLDGTDAETKLQVRAGIMLNEEETLNAKLCWALGLYRSIDLIGRLKSALSTK